MLGTVTYVPSSTMDFIATRSQPKGRGNRLVRAGHQSLELSKPVCQLGDEASEASVPGERRAGFERCPPANGECCQCCVYSSLSAQRKIRKLSVSYEHVSRLPHQPRFLSEAMPAVCLSGNIDQLARESCPFHQIG